MPVCLLSTALRPTPLVDVAGTAEQRRWAFLRERIGIFAANGLNRRDLFKVSTARYGVDVLSHPWLRSADVVCLNWINQGMLSLTDVGRLAAMGKRLVWTLHDMWCMTGICHHAYGCDGYERECGHCRFMRFPYGNDLSHRVWKRKNAYTTMPTSILWLSADGLPTVAAAARCLRAGRCR